MSDNFVTLSLSAPKSPKGDLYGSLIRMLKSPLGDLGAESESLKYMLIVSANAEAVTEGE